MKQFHVLAVLAVLMTVGPRIVRPCSIADWQPMTLAEQAEETGIIVYGEIIAHYPMPDHPMLTTAYIAEMEIFCPIKGESLPDRVNISEAGELTSCHHTKLPVNQTFITFLKRKQPSGLLIPDEVNYLSVAFEPTNANVKQVAEAVPELLQQCTELSGASPVSASAVRIIISLMMLSMLRRVQLI